LGANLTVSRNLPKNEEEVQPAVPSGDATSKSFDGAKFIEKNGCRQMPQGSKTEPVLRTYAETASSEVESNRLPAWGRRIARMD